MRFATSAVIRCRRLRSAAIAIPTLAGICALSFVSSALASGRQEAIFQEEPHLLTDPSGTLAQMRSLGVDRMRVILRWSSIAPNAGSHRRPRGFDASDPAAYPARNWRPWDTVVKDAQSAGIKLDFDLAGGAPLWATGPGAPRDKPHPNWDPSPREFGAFVHAVGTRYSGRYDPRTHSISPGNQDDLPAVSYWSIWNEPDYGPSLAPQGTGPHLSVENSPRLYRNLVDAGWGALQGTRHGHDTILIGELAPRGLSYWGIFSGMKPLVFLRAMYCVDHSYRKLRGPAAAARGCPSTAAGSARFRSANPGLFQASGISDHPYMRWYPPNQEAQPDPDYSTLGELGGFERALDRLQRVYRSSRRLPIYDTEFGYITSPPKHPTKRLPWASVTTAAYYLNWAEYISWLDPRMSSFEQYLLYDPLPPLASNDYGGFASGLLTDRGKPKPTYDAWRLPLYLPLTTARRGARLEVWGCVRPAHFASTDPGGGPQSAQIQFQPRSRGAFQTVQTVAITSTYGYFDLRVKLPGSGTVRLSYTYPAKDPLLPAGSTIRSRDVRVRLTETALGR
ncbi:MAG: hypothetical protein ACR2LV_11550 [Solirubrobacteraceae bacterium]